jgi:hypothetical protein
MVDIIIYETGKHQVDVRLEGETLWLSLQQLADLFERDKSVISRHLKNIFDSRELDRDRTVAKNATVQMEGEREVIRQIEHYNLDAIISVGYRVNSVKATRFRQWATSVLREHLTKGYTVNEKRLAQKQQEVQRLKDGIRILSRAIEEKAEDTELKWLKLYARGLRLLDDYDQEGLDVKGDTRAAVTYPSHEEYYSVIKQMRKDFESSVFGQEQGPGFKSAIEHIRQGFGEQDLYPSFEEKAATLLYLVVKNHAFVDGNKRIAAASFLLFLQKNNRLMSAQDVLTISNEALAGLTLFIAVSKPDEMETVKRLIISILNRNK